MVLKEIEVMAVKMADSKKLKYAVYLRPEAYSVVDLLREPNFKDHGEAKPQSLSSVVAQIVRAYREILGKSPWAITQSKAYLAQKKLDFSAGGYRSKVQVYLDPEDSEFLQEYATARTKGNASTAINLLIGEYAAIAIVCSSVL